MDNTECNCVCVCLCVRVCVWREGGMCMCEAVCKGWGVGKCGIIEKVHVR